MEFLNHNQHYINGCRLTVASTDSLVALIFGAQYASYAQARDIRPGVCAHWLNSHAITTFSSGTHGAYL